MNSAPPKPFSHPFKMFKRQRGKERERGREGERERGREGERESEGGGVKRLVGWKRVTPD